jgi:tetratricopeptide (TPR) repeat protein
MSAKRWLLNKYFIGAALSFFSFVVYLRTLAPTVTFIDSGELASDVITLGIPHPTGYPLFTLVGWLFVHIPLGLRPIFQLNVMSAVFCAAALFFFFQCFILLLSWIDTGSHTRRLGLSQTGTLVAAAAGTSTLAFSETYLAQALSIEVYPLHLLLLSLTLLLFIKSQQGGNRSAQPSHSGEPAYSEETNSSVPVSWYGFAFVLGLCFANHMTTILLAPGFLYLFFAKHGFSREMWPKVFVAIVPFLLGLSVYLYLPIRATENPTLNWGDPTTLERFWWHVTGKQYRVWILSSAETAIRQLKYFLGGFPSEFAYAPLALVLVGVIQLFRSNRTIFYFTLILFLSCLLYSINYDIHDIDSYFLLAYIMTAVWIAFGAGTLFKMRSNHRGKVVSTLACVAIGLTPLAFHYETADQSDSYPVEDYTKNMFDSLEKNALVLTYQWDYFVSPSYYLQLVEGYRNDATVIDKELLRRSWYFKQLEHQHPRLVENSRGEIDAFLKELYKFEHNLPYDPAVIEARYEEMIRSFLVKNEPVCPVYVTPEIEQEFTRGLQRVPSGLAFRIYPDTTYHDITPRDFAFHPITKRDTYSEAIRNLYAGAYCNQGIYLAIRGKREKAVESFRKALQVTPGFPEALRWLRQLGVEL